MSIDVLKPGALSQLQDLGREGFQHLGVVVGGAMDSRSHRCANALVGNDAHEATLEITLMGPSLRFNASQVIALCGADLSARIGDEPVPMNRAMRVEAGTQLDFGRRVDGMRCYLAVRGGFDVTPVMDSRSTYARGAFGGLNGRALKKGDVLPTRKTSLALREAPVPMPLRAPTDVVRVIAGQQWGLFTEDAQRAFTQSAFRISPQSDRMGYRLEGPVLARRHALEMVSEGVVFGTVQVPPDGQPIVLMADRQTTGGYPKIACVAGVDLPLLAQMAPQQTLHFELISLDAAQALYLEHAQSLDAWCAEATA